MKKLTALALCLALAGCESAPKKPDPEPTWTPVPSPTGTPTPTPTVTTTPSPSGIPVTVAPAFHKLLQVFLEDGKAKGFVPDISRLSIEFVDAIPGYGSEIVGLCRTGSNSGPQVLIKKPWWDSWSSSPVQQSSLLHHELGHCLLGRPHLNTVRSNGNPTSMMNSVVLWASVFSGDRPYYIQELFNTPISMMASAKAPNIYVCEGGK